MIHTTVVELTEMSTKVAVFNHGSADPNFMVKPKLIVRPGIESRVFMSKDSPKIHCATQRNEISASSSQTATNLRYVHADHIYADFKR